MCVTLALAQQTVGSTLPVCGQLSLSGTEIAGCQQVFSEWLLLSTCFQNIFTTLYTHSEMVTLCGGMTK